MIIQNAKNKKHNRSFNTIRSICLTICLTLIIGISPVYANTVNISVPDNLFSYIVTSGGNVDFTSSDAQGISATSKLTWYFGRLSQTIARIGSFTYQNGTYLSTIYTYLTTTLNNIATSSYNTALSVNSLMTSSMNIDWAAESITYGYYGSLSNAVNQSNALSQGAYPDIYVRVEFSNEIFGKAIKMIFPVIPYNTMDLNNADYYIKEVYTLTNNGLGGTLVSTTKQRLYFADQYHTSMFYFDGSGFTMSNGNYRKILIFHITGDHNSYIYASRNTEAFSLSNNSEDYYKVANYINLSKLSTDDIVDSLNNLTVQSDFDDSDILEAINNLSLQDNDVKLNLTINNNTGSDGTTIIGRLQQFLNTGVSVGDFFDNVDAAESGWFSQSNSDVINTLSRGYTDFYE